MDMWSYRVDQPSDAAIAGYDVEALDGSIGRVERTPSFSAGQQALAVDTGLWNSANDGSCPLASSIASTRPNRRCT